MTNRIDIGLGHRAWPHLSWISASALACGAASALAGTTNYIYDNAGRLRSVTQDDAANVTYTLDAAGNRVKVVTTRATLPRTPTGLTASAACATHVNLAWNPVADFDGSSLTGYKIYRGGTQVGTTGGTSYVDTSSSPGATNTYAVSAYDASGETGQSNSASAVTPVEPPPTVPGGLTATVAGDTQVNLAWIASSAVTCGLPVGGYNVYRDGNLIGTSVTTTFSDTTAATFGSYLYTVAAYDTARVPSSQSSFALGDVFRKITDSLGTVLTAAVSLYTTSNQTNYPSVYVWLVNGPSGNVLIAVTGAYGLPPACGNGATQFIATGYKRTGCILYAAPSAYGH